MDDDDLARKITYGYIRKDGLWRNIFWNTDTSAQKIRKNSNNTGSLVIFPDQTVSGMLRLDLNSSYNLKIVEINSELYKESKEIRILNSINSTSNTGAIGYLQNDLSVSSNTANAKLFNLKENNYAIFLSSTGTTADFLKYKYYFTNQTGSIIYTVPLDDSLPDQMAYYGNTIIIDTDGSYIGKEQEFIRPK